MTELSKKDEQFIWHPFTPLISKRKPIVISSASGVYLHTADGRKILDAISSWWVNLHGHGHPHIAEAIAKQANTLEHVIFAGFTHEPAIMLAENLLSILPKNQHKIFFSDDGSTAVEVAIKIAMQFMHARHPERSKIIAFRDAYHGDTFGSMSVAERGGFNTPFTKYLFEVVFLHSPSSTHSEKILAQFEKETADGSTVAFIYEPLIQAAGGMKFYSSELLDSLLEIAKRNRVITIADEVFTGFGRTGKLFASDYLRHKPDIIALSKGITGGALPLGATSCSEEILEPFKSDSMNKVFFHGHSYTANPIACAAANASFELLMAPACQHSIKHIADMHKKFVDEITAVPALKAARALGTVLTLEFKTRESSSYFNNLRDHIYDYFMERDILLRPLGNVLYLLPPYVITKKELNGLYSEIRQFATTFTQD